MSISPVLIVGAGPTGLVLAIELARRGVPVHLVDRRPEPLGRDRAIVVKSRSLEMLAGMGLADRFLRRGRIIRAIDLFSGRTPVATIGLDGLDSPFPFDLCIPEEETERILTEELRRLGGAVERGVEFTALEQGERGVAARLRSFDGGERTREAGWLVGTDGLHSAVRETIGDAFEGHEYPTLWGVADAHLTRWDRPDHHATVQIEPPVVIAFPLRDGRWRFTFQADADDPDHLRTIGARLAAICSGAALRDPDQPQLFRTHARVAAKYRIGRVLLAGDAAHASTPFEGHGMNTGMQDSYNLGWKLALVATGAAPQTLLDSYEAERRPVAQAIAASGDDAEARAASRETTARQALVQFLADAQGRRVAAIAEAETPSAMIGARSSMISCPRRKLRRGHADRLSGRRRRAARAARAHASPARADRRARPHPARSARRGAARRARRRARAGESGHAALPTASAGLRRYAQRRGRCGRGGPAARPDGSAPRAPRCAATVPLPRPAGRPSRLARRATIPRRAAASPPAHSDQLSMGRMTPRRAAPPEPAWRRREWPYGRASWRKPDTRTGGET